MNLAEGNQLIEQKLYRPLQVTIVDLDRPGREGPATRPDLPLQSVGEDRIAAYTAEIMDAIRKLQPQEEARSLFAQYTGALEKISKNLMSLRLTVEQVEGRLYGVIVCEARQPLSAKEIGLIQEYCDGQYGEARSAGYAYCSREAPNQGMYIHFWQKENDRLLDREELGAAIKAGRISNLPVVSEINKDTFWILIETAKHRWGQDLEHSAEWLEDQLLMLGPQQAQNFHDITCVYEHLANQYGLWDAANIINSFTRSDQGFHHFRAWLIAQGKDVYLDALWNPDSLAEVELYGDCSFEQLSYVGTNAFQRLTGQSAYTCANPAVYQKLNQELGAEITYRDDIWYPRPMRALPAAYPRLCAARGGRKRFDTDEIGWNTEHPKIRQLLDQGKRYDESKRRPRENRGEIR